MAITGATGRVGSPLVDKLGGRDPAPLAVGDDYAAKVAQEQKRLEGPLTVRIVRPDPFHEYVDQLLGWTTQDGVAILRSGERSSWLRPVAETVAEAAEESGTENGKITEVTGPREEHLAEAAAALVANRGDSLEIREERQSGNPDADASAEGAALPPSQLQTSQAPASRNGSRRRSRLG